MHGARQALGVGVAVFNARPRQRRWRGQRFRSFPAALATQDTIRDGIVCAVVAVHEVLLGQGGVLVRIGELVQKRAVLSLFAPVFQKEGADLRAVSAIVRLLALQTVRDVVDGGRVVHGVNSAGRDIARGLGRVVLARGVAARRGDELAVRGGQRLVADLGRKVELEVELAGLAEVLCAGAGRAGLRLLRARVLAAGPPVKAGERAVAHLARAAVRVLHHADEGVLAETVAAYQGEVLFVRERRHKEDESTGLSAELDDEEGHLRSSLLMAKAYGRVRYYMRRQNLNWCGLQNI